MTEANKDSIEARVAKWKATVAPPSGFNWIYFVLGAVIIALLVALFARSKKKSGSITSSESTVE